VVPVSQFPLDGQQWDTLKATLALVGKDVPATTLVWALIDMLGGREDVDVVRKVFEVALIANIYARRSSIDPELRTLLARYFQSAAFIKAQAEAKKERQVTP
jgi:hypothetical protein